MTLKRPARAGPLISLVPMIDVMLILLVFFMVTSTYLDLDMIPAARRSDAPAAPDPAPSPAPSPGDTVMIRLGGDGIPVVGGSALPGPALTALLRDRLAEDPLAQVIVLPSGAATTQALISVMDAATRAGARRLRVVRLEARP
ncbi:biopolymer transporter ExbD [Pukyongiella litopenaei]|uniref:Biopolymer transporter ExbD n=2 Tax=Pukyongiella litopenaei TaxID=2605946 RepID=A0A2S0MV24_9RHOB|nr:biopolymer transporter ExbD [Pukyongiella litopenaei]